ncbi:hypothetical protein HAX54_011509 [Datura stramonium]|uniref:Uncharacterized protein n=1 Tax=Datura stramonium TaxID=4076 RepID=A0ABS8TI56_DATST|nr:hypothetical protein [Datura stramonium]
MVLDGFLVALMVEDLFVPLETGLENRNDHQRCNLESHGLNKNGSSGFLWIWRLTICSGASGNVTTLDVAFMLNDLAVKTDVDHRKLTLCPETLLTIILVFIIIVEHKSFLYPLQHVVGPQGINDSGHLLPYSECTGGDVSSWEV